ncbi:MAG: methyltransferase domain-containing protein [Pseudonocardiaceae bacterium]
MNSGDQSHRHAITDRDPDNRNRTLILCKETDLVHGKVVRHVVLTLDATMQTALILTLPQAIELADALRMGKTPNPGSRSRRVSRVSTRRSDCQVTDPDNLRWRMVEGVASDRYVISQWQAPFRQWQPSLLAVARHLFIPDTIWIKNDGSGPPLVALGRDKDPQRWLELAYANEAVVAQVDDGNPGSSGWASTSSASSPVIVAVMLAALDVQDGQRASEIGTGTGYNAALLAHRLGAERVVSIELDPDMAAHARKALPNAGFGAVTVITGDSALLLRRRAGLVDRRRRWHRHRVHRGPKQLYATARPARTAETRTRHRRRR